MSLPLKAKIAIRDAWSNEDKPLQKAIANVQKLLGLQVTCEPDWALLITELEKTYPDRADLVTIVARIVQVWCEVMAQLFDGEEHEEWTETLLENLKEARSQLRIYIDVFVGLFPSTTWDANRGGFIINVPKEPIRDARDSSPRFIQEILSAFEKPKEPPITDGTTASTDKQDEWATVDGETMNVVVGKPKPDDRPVEDSPACERIQYLPEPEMITRPDLLLLGPPYLLSVFIGGAHNIQVHCSHSPTLEVLYAYLKRWVRTNPNDTTKPPMVDIQLHQGYFGLGAMYDRLSITHESRWGASLVITPTLILHLAETQLGYRRAHSDVTHWEFRRDVPFKRG